jgi:hypothetical protein
LGYFTIFTAFPAILILDGQAVQAGETNKTETNGAERSARLVEKPNKSKNNPELPQRWSKYLLPHQKRKYSDIISEMGGGDNCPGNAISGGTYTAAAPFTDSGNTTGANDMVTRICDSYCYSYFDVAGPDHIYTFTLTGLGPNPKIEVSATSSKECVREVLYEKTIGRW